MSDVDDLPRITDGLITGMESISKLVPPWRAALGSLADLTPGAMTYHGVEGSSGAAWDGIAADLGPDRLEAARLRLLDVLAAPMDEPPGPSPADAEGGN